MKRIIGFTMALAFCLSGLPAFAATYTAAVPFNNVSAASAAVKTSGAYNVIGKPNKTLFVSGVTLNSSPTSVTFKHMSGTLIAECAPTSTGPWAQCVANEYGQTAVSKTTDGAFTWRSLTNYVRLKWTSGTVGGKLKVWLNYSE